MLKRLTNHRWSPTDLLAEAHIAIGDRSSGLLELEAAASSFQRLGARIDLAQVTDRIA